MTATPLLRAVRKLRVAVRKGVTHWTLERNSTYRGMWACQAHVFQSAHRPTWFYARDPVKAAEMAVRWALTGNPDAPPKKRKPAPRAALAIFPGRD